MEKYKRKKCVECGKELKFSFVLNAKTKDGHKVCSKWCKDNWDLDTK